MPIEKIVNIDQIEITENGCVQVRTKTTIVENGAMISESLHRHVIAPGCDYSNEHDRVVSICRVIHTPEVIKNYQISQ